MKYYLLQRKYQVCPCYKCDLKTGVALGFRDDFISNSERLVFFGFASLLGYNPQFWSNLLAYSPACLQISEERQENFLAVSLQSKTLELRCFSAGE